LAAVTEGGIFLWALVHKGKSLQRWRFATLDSIKSSPTVVNGVVYVGSDDTFLYAIDATTGKERWKFDAAAPMSSGPVVANGIVYVGANPFNGINSSGTPAGAGGLYAVEAASGTQVWLFTISPTGLYGFSTPAVVDGMVYVGSLDGNLYVLDALTGKERWRFRTGISIQSSPAVAGGMVYIGSNDHYLYAVDALTGTVRWLFPTGGFVVSSPAVANGVVYVGLRYQSVCGRRPDRQGTLAISYWW
jgi:outer membrane protein assembly factor BamB